MAVSPRAVFDKVRQWDKKTEAFGFHMIERHPRAAMLIPAICAVWKATEMMGIKDAHVGMFLGACAALTVIGAKGLKANAGRTLDAWAKNDPSLERVDAQPLDVASRRSEPRVERAAFKPAYNFV